MANIKSVAQTQNENILKCLLLGISFFKLFDI